MKKKTAPKTGMLSVALAKIRSLKSDVEKYANAYNDASARIISIKSEKNSEVAQLVAERDGNQTKIRTLKRDLTNARNALTDITTDRNYLYTRSQDTAKELGIQDATIDSLKEQLVATATHRDDLYTANQKFAEDDHEYRISVHAELNRQTNDNINMSEQLDRLNKQVENSRTASESHWAGFIESKAEIDQLNIKIANLIKTTVPLHMLTEVEQARDCARAMQHNYWNLLLDARRANIERAEEIEELNKRMVVGQGQVDLLQDRVAELKADLAQEKSESVQKSIDFAEVLNKRDLKIANLQQRLDREQSAHTMTALDRAGRIDELLGIEQKLSERLAEFKEKINGLLAERSSLNEIIRLAGDAHCKTMNSLLAARQRNDEDRETFRLMRLAMDERIDNLVVDNNTLVWKLQQRDTVTEIKKEAQSFAKIVRNRIAACKSSGPSTFTKVWHWLTKV